MKHHIGFYRNFTSSNRQVVDEFIKLNDSSIVNESLKEDSIMLVLLKPEKMGGNKDEDGDVVMDSDSVNRIVGVYICIEQEQNVWFVQYYDKEPQDVMSNNYNYLTMISDVVSEYRNQQPTSSDERNLFYHQQQELMLNNFIQINFLQTKITQIGNMHNRIFVQDYKDVSVTWRSVITNFLRENCTFEIDKPNSINERILLFFSTNDNNELTGFQYIKYNEVSGIAERYASCTKKKYQGKGIMRQIDNTAVIYMQLKFPKLRYIWTGLNMSNFFDRNTQNGTLDTTRAKREALRKIRSGFSRDLYVSNTTPLNSITPFRFLSFHWRPGRHTDEQQLITSINRAEKLIDDFNNTLYIPLNVITELRRQRSLYHNQEYGGYFDRNLENGEVFNPKQESLIPRTSNDAVCNVPITIDGTHLFSFHTHPDGCYTAYGHGLGWPSSLDLIAMLQLAKLDTRQGITLDRISTIHFVMASEGIYSIRLSKELAAYYRNSEANREILNELIPGDSDTPQTNQITRQITSLLERLNSIKGANISGKDTPVADFMILQALRTINKFTINVDPKPIRAFKVTFERYGNIMSTIKFTRY